MKTLSNKLTIFILSAVTIIFMWGCGEQGGTSPEVTDPNDANPPSWIQGTWQSAMGASYEFTSDDVIQTTASGEVGSFKDEFTASEIIARTLVSTTTEKSYFFSVNRGSVYYHYYFELSDPSKTSTSTGDVLVFHFDNSTNFNKTNPSVMSVNLTKQ